jgi:hypothetical protein
MAVGRPRPFALIDPKRPLGATHALARRHSTMPLVQYRTLIEHCVIRSVDGTVGITILQIASAYQGAFAFSFKVASDRSRVLQLATLRNPLLR